ncbi:MAG: hypothetical protein AAGA85_20930 [Bacteroidota bacterium]
MIKGKLTLTLSMLCLVVSLSSLAQVYDKKNLLVQEMKSKDFPNAPKQVYINNFKIYYQMIAEAEKTTYGGRQFGGGSYTGDATARLAVGVEGIAPDDLQQLTDEIYNYYVGRLKDMGFEVACASNIDKIEFYQDHEQLDGPRINQEQVKGSLMVVPTGFSYHVKKVTKKGKEKSGGLMAAVTSVNGATATEFTSALYHKGLPKISQELEDRIVIDVALNVPSIYLDPKSKLGTAKVKGGANLRLENARATYVSGKGNRPGAAYPEVALELSLTKPMQITGVFAEEEFKAVATKQRTAIPDYGIFFVTDTEVALTNTISCKAEDYQREVQKTLRSFLDESLSKLSIGLTGEKVK